ncbi:MAG: rhodanese-like domain-containing protein [Lachnospiraceae bacterium]
MEVSIVSSKEVEKYLFHKDYVVIDVRSPKEYRAKHLKGAVCIPYERLAAQAPLLKNRTLILYCDRGGLSMKAAKELAEAGYDVKSMVGGIESYQGRYLEGYENRRHR